MAMTIAKITPKKGISYKKRKEANKAMKDEFGSKEEKPSMWDDIVSKVMGKSFEEKKKENDKKNLKRIQDKKKNK